MLKHPYTRYARLFVYHLDLSEVPEVDDPDFIGAWQEGETIVLFFHREKESEIAALCRRYGCTIVYQADLDYADWEAGTEVSAFTVGDLTVAPVWEETPADITIDPSVIFGSGFHPTTRLCLQSLLQLYDTTDPPLELVYDLGCGTGLLAMAAAVKGARKIVAVDYNGLACDTARANAHTNTMSDRIEVRRLDLSQQCPDSLGIDLIMANLHHPLLLQLFSRPSFWQARYYIFSGVFTSREADLLAALPAGKLRFLDRQSSKKWCVWVLQNTAPGKCAAAHHLRAIM